METQAIESLLQRLFALRQALNDGARGCCKNITGPCGGLDLTDTTMSAQLARYPGDGRGYVRHRDTPVSAKRGEDVDRKVRGTEIGFIRCWCTRHFQIATSSPTTCERVTYESVACCATYGIFQYYYCSLLALPVIIWSELPVGSLYFKQECIGAA